MKTKGCTIASSTATAALLAINKQHTPSSLPNAALPGSQTASVAYFALLWLAADVATCVEVDGFNSLLVRSASEASSMQFNWVAGPATTQGEFFKGEQQHVLVYSWTLCASACVLCFPARKGFEASQRRSRCNLLTCCCAASGAAVACSCGPSHCGELPVWLQLLCLCVRPDRQRQDAHHDWGAARRVRCAATKRESALLCCCQLPGSVIIAAAG